MTMRLNQFCKMNTISRENMEVLGSWHASRYEVMRTKHIDEDTVVVLEAHETLCEKSREIRKVYLIGIEHTNGFDSFTCHVYFTLAEAWRDWEFMVAAGASVPVARQDVRIRNFVTGEILDTSFSQSRDFLSQLLEVLNLYWDYRYSEPDYRQAWEYDNMILASYNNKEFVWIIDEMPKHGQILIKPLGFSKINA